MSDASLAPDCRFAPAIRRRHLTAVLSNAGAISSAQRSAAINVTTPRYKRDITLHMYLGNDIRYMYVNI